MARNPNAWKIFLFALGGLAGVLLLAALAVLLVADPDSYKSRAEAAASEALGMNVTVEGRLQVGVVPGLHVVLENVRVRNRETEIAFVKQAVLAIKLLSLFEQNIRFGSVALNGARVTIERDGDGRYNYEKPAEADQAFPALDIRELTFADSIISYAEETSGSGIQSTGCNGAVDNIRHPGGAAFLARVSLTGRLACSQVRARNIAISEFNSSVEAHEGVFDFKRVTMRVFGGQGSGSLHIDRSVAVPAFQGSYSLSRFHAEDFFKALAPGRSVRGLMDFSATLSMSGDTRAELRRSASGEISLSGTNLTLAGVDIDKELSRYASSQRFNLVDVGAFLFAGPIGLAAAKGYDLARLGRQSGGSTQIRTVVSNWEMKRGVVYARDVAMATPDNRFALKGGLNFVDDRYDDVIVALLDSKGCVKMRQKISGPFSNPAVEKPGILATLAGPALTMLSKARALLPGTRERCEVFYRGSVAPPK